MLSVTRPYAAALGDTIRPSAVDATAGRAAQSRVEQTCAYQTTRSQSQQVVL